ncbi:MAG: hypothetical protein L0207_04440 [Chlamydiae bacterium]|nr:hypothetical protein [Chlamydiota bacterium]
MQDLSEDKRLFFGIEIDAPWPDQYPEGRLIDSSSRHLTLAFLGNVSFAQIQKQLTSFPKGSIKIGPVGKCDKVIFLPNHNHPRVVAYHIDWFTGEKNLINLHRELLNWLEKNGYKTDKRDLLSHISLARAPFETKEWEKSFTLLPILAKAIHLYESRGNLQYEPLWSCSFILPFEEWPHTADIAFLIRGENPTQMYLHAFLALCYTFPILTPYFKKIEVTDFEKIVSLLNNKIAKADAEIGCPLKAISYHGQMREKEKGMFEWEMVVDV